MSISSEIKTHDLSDEAYREYEWIEDGTVRTYRIDNPDKLYLRPGGTTHRVLDKDGIVHSVPTVGQSGCVLRWKPRDPANPVQF